MNDVLRIARLKIALQRAFLGRAILRVIKFRISTFSDAGSRDSQPPSSSSAEDDQKDNHDESRLKRGDIKGGKM